jgi:hypothetical protein
LNSRNLRRSERRRYRITKLNHYHIAEAREGRGK